METSKLGYVKPSSGSFKSTMFPSGGKTNVRDCLATPVDDSSANNNAGAPV